MCSALDRGREASELEESGPSERPWERVKMLRQFLSPGRVLRSQLPATGQVLTDEPIESMDGGWSVPQNQ